MTPARRCPPGPAGPVAFGDRIDRLLPINGRKRHLLTDTLGLPLALVVHAADIQDRHGLAQVCRRVRRRFPWLTLVFADGGYQGDQAACAAAQERLRLEIVKRPRDAEGFHLLPRRLRGLLTAFPSGIGSMTSWPSMGHRADLRLARPQPPSRQGRRDAGRNQHGDGRRRDRPTPRTVARNRLKVHNNFSERL
jgi:transposase